MTPATDNLRRIEGLLYFAGFAASIPAANWMLGNFGTVCPPDSPCLIPVAPGIMAPSGVVMVGLALVLRDLDIIAPMAARGLANVAVSVTTLDGGLARRMEPRAATPTRRLETLAALSRAGIPTAVMAARISAIRGAMLSASLRTGTTTLYWGLLATKKRSLSAFAGRP